MSVICSCDCRMRDMPCQIKCISPLKSGSSHPFGISSLHAPLHPTLLAQSVFQFLLVVQGRRNRSGWSGYGLTTFQVDLSVMVVKTLCACSIMGLHIKLATILDFISELRLASALRAGGGTSGIHFVHRTAIQTRDLFRVNRGKN